MTATRAIAIAANLIVFAITVYRTFGIKRQARQLQMKVPLTTVLLADGTSQISTYACGTVLTYWACGQGSYTSCESIRGSFCGRALTHGVAVIRVLFVLDIVLIISLQGRSATHVSSLLHGLVSRWSLTTRYPTSSSDQTIDLQAIYYIAPSVLGHDAGTYSR